MQVLVYASVILVTACVEITKLISSISIVDSVSKGEGGG